MSYKIAIVLFCLALSLCLSTADERPAHCFLPHPRGVGLCEMLIFGHQYNPATNQCEEWSEGGCKTEGGHSFRLKADCEAECVTSVRSKL